MAERSAPAQRKSVGRGRWLGNAALSFGSLAFLGLIALGAEWLARMWDPDYLIRVRGLYVYSPTYGWAGRPGAVAPMGDGRVTLNSRGYRGREPSVADHSGKRVVVLGDSVAFGYGVSDEQAFPYLLDVRDDRLDVFNFAVAGYGPGQELLLLRREVPPLRPDVVVLALCLRNDFVDAVLPVALYDGVTPRPRFRLEGERLVLDESSMPHSVLAPAVHRLIDSSHLFNHLFSVLHRAEPEDPHDWRYRKREVLKDPDYALRLTLALVLEMDTFCRRNGWPLLVACFPSGLSYERKNDLPARFIASLREKGVPTVDMAAQFRQLGLSAEEAAIDRTGHLSAHGHAMSFEILQREIVARLSAPASGSANDWPDRSHRGGVASESE